MARRAVVFGGGWAGCSAAWKLAKAGFRVLLCDAGPRLGGRATSFPSGDGYDLDNGQHLFSGAYSHTMALLREIGTLDKIKFQTRLRVPFFSEGGHTSVLEGGTWPGPLSLMGGIRRFELLGPSSKRGIMSLGLRSGLDLPLAALGGSTQSTKNQTVLQWLTHNGQTQEAIRCFWEPLTLAALNAPIEKAQALGLAQSLASGFFKSAASSGLGFSTVPLADLLDPSFENWLKQHRGEVRRNCRVESIKIEKGRAVRASLAGMKDIEGEVFVVALNRMDVAGLFEEAAKHQLGLEKLKEFKYSPITAVHLWTKSEISSEMLGAFAAPEGKTQPNFHWMFNKNAFAEQVPWQGFLSSFVASASNELAQMEKEDLLFALYRQLKLYFPHFKEIEVLNHRILKEKRATPLFEAGVFDLRKDYGSAIPNMAFAGDWTQNRLPATIEGAALSGLAAARRLGA